MEEIKREDKTNNKELLLRVEECGNVCGESETGLGNILNMTETEEGMKKRRERRLKDYENNEWWLEKRSDSKYH